MIKIFFNLLIQGIIIYEKIIKIFQTNNSIKDQDELLKKLINKSKKTQFGKDHNFAIIKNYSDYKNRVPIRDYEDFSNYINQIKSGKKNILWPGYPIYFAKTSGTTSGTKYIPITKNSIPNQINSAKKMLFDYIKLKKSIDILNGKVLFLSGSPKLELINNIYVGRLSGIVNHHKPFLLKHIYLPSNRTNLIENWEEKINKIADETLGKDLRVIGGIPPWLQMYFDVLKNKTGKKIKDIFPNLKLICHGGVNFEPYRANLFDTIGSEIDTLETFPASEGFFAYQNNLEKNDLILQTNSGIFYEFILMDNIKNKNSERITLKNVEINKNYAMIITTNAGLWSYNLGDTIKFTSLTPYKIIVTGRTKQYISAFGEHVIVEEVDKALIETCKSFKEVKVIEYTVGPKIENNNQKSHHQWLIEFEKEPKNLYDFEKELDLNLQKLNPYYKDLIQDKVLTTLKIKTLKKKSFINFMKSIGKLGGQNKVPRISNDREIINEILKSN